MKKKSRLIQMVKENPILYDLGNVNHKNSKIKNVIWDQIAAVNTPLGPSWVPLKTTLVTVSGKEYQDTKSTISLLYAICDVRQPRFTNQKHTAIKCFCPVLYVKQESPPE